MTFSLGSRLFARFLRNGRPRVVALAVLLMAAQPVAAQTIAACGYIAQAANEGRLDEVRRHGVPSPQPFPQPPDRGYAEYRERLDIDGDGRDELVYIFSEGTAHFESIAIYDEDLKEIEYATSPRDDWQSDRLRWPYDTIIVTYGGVHYIVGKDDDALSYAASVSKDGVLAVNCTFGHEPTARSRIVSSRDDAVCQLVLQGTLEYSVFDRLHAYETSPLTGPRETHPNELAAGIDFDNDGSSDLVVEMRLSSGAGRGCDATTLAALNGTRSGLNDSPTAGLLRAIGGRCGDTHVRPFAFNGKIYLESQSPPGVSVDDHAVFKIESGSRTEVCRIEARTVNFVLGPLQDVLAAAKDAGVHPWIAALRQPGLAAAQVMLDNGYDVNERMPNPGPKAIVGNLPDPATPLMFAAAAGRVDLAALLLDQGARLDPPDVDFSPLMMAVANGKDDVTELLLERGANPNAEVRYSTAPDLAMRVGTAHTIELLVRHGADFRKQVRTSVRLRGDVYEVLSKFAKESGDTELLSLLRDAISPHVELVN
jgi:hypothetical protein